MKLKYYLRGAGMGIIIAVLIMILGGGTGNRTMTDGEIIRRAQELGMTKADDGSGTVKDYNNKSSAASSESSEAASSEAPAEPSSDAARSSTAQSSVAESSAAASSAAQSSEAASSEAPSSSAASIATDPVDNGNTVTITVVSGMLSDKVADLLQQAGLISDAKDFNRYLISKGYDRQILKGDCVIKKGSSYEEIAKILISKNR